MLLIDWRGVVHVVHHVIDEDLDTVAMRGVDELLQLGFGTEFSLSAAFKSRGQ